MILDFASPFGRLILQLLIIIIFGRILGRAVKFLHQPPVIGEILAGIILGPSVLGAFQPEIFNFVFESNSLELLQTVSQLGLMFFMFSVGLHSSRLQWDSHGRRAIFISIVSIILPFSLGTLGALWLYEESNTTSLLIFALFGGISLSITAFPVLARMLQDRGLVNLKISKLALSCAAIDDVVAWVILALIVGLVKGSGTTQAFGMILSAFLGVIVLMKGVRPLLEIQLRKCPTDADRFILGIITLLVSALYFEWTGIHALFGAYIAGTAMPAHENYRQFMQNKIEFLGGFILLPAFFAVTGLRTQINLLTSLSSWLIGAAITLVAILGKFGGAFLAARYVGYSKKEASFIGTLMNTRGLMELVVLNIGLELGVISQELFTIMVLMAVITTMMTGPTLRALGITGDAGKNCASASGFGASSRPTT